MAGITDLPFRNIVLKFGAALVVSEMIASQELVQAVKTRQSRAELGLKVEKTAVQIAGREAYWMSEGAKMVAGQGARIIDFNMGCPAKKVTNGLSGSALMRQPDHALVLVKAVVDAVDVPVTLKMRLGWDESQLNAAEIAKRAEDVGVKMITVHGRTRCQFYKGQANWHAIQMVKEAVNIPVIANGDIIDENSARRALAHSGADGVMVGRGAQGAPWRLAQISDALRGKAPQKALYGGALCELVIEHYQAMLGFYGVEQGMKCARKHLSWYLEPLDNGAELRKLIIREPDPEKVISELRAGLSDSKRLAA
ncbi:MAG: tRNA dihydrouridine synthase DusB [Rhodobacteraceae bacterium]|nr:tRNA dihydrouridine synthase DusB [Paracoccaceae bacterium]